LGGREPGVPAYFHVIDEFEERPPIDVEAKILKARHEAPLQLSA
jgi:hypothetical protein